MTLPWDAPDAGANGVPWSAEQMQPDSPIPAAAPEPITAVATNTVTGQQIVVDLAPRLSTAIDTAITAAVAAHPVLSTAVKTVVRDRERADRSVMQNSVLDVVVAIVAALFTIVSPQSPVTGVLWIAAAVLASKTLIQLAGARLVPEVVP